MKTAVATAALILLGAAAAAAPVELHFFWSAACPDCMVMKEFLATLAQEYPDLVIVEHEVAFSPENWRRMSALAQEYGLPRATNPAVFVGNVGVVGIGRAVELQIEEEILRCRTEGCPSPLDRLPATPRWVLSPLEIALILTAGLAVLLLLWGR